LGQLKILILSHIFAQNFVHLALKLIQQAIGSIRNLDTGSYFVIHFVHLTLKLIQHAIAIGSIKNIDIGSYCCNKSSASSTKVDSTNFGSIRNLDTGSNFVINFVHLALKLIQHAIAHTIRPVNDFTEGSTQEAPMGAT
jgi:hypothetical protein